MSEAPNVRCRREGHFRSEKVGDAVYAPMPPLEAKKAFLSIAPKRLGDGRRGAVDQFRMLMFIGVEGSPRGQVVQRPRLCRVARRGAQEGQCTRLRK